MQHLKKKILLIFLTLFFTNLTFASDEKPGRFFEDQPDVTNGSVTAKTSAGGAASAYIGLGPFDMSIAIQ
jgi:hypothetical protein